MLLEAKTHVVTAVRCMMSAVAKSICSKYFINMSTAFDACMCETRISSIVAFSLPPYHHLSRTRWPPSAGDVNNTALGVMSVQQLEPVNDSRWTLVSLKWGRRVRGVDQQRQWQYPSGRHVVHAAWRVIEVELHSMRCLYVVARARGKGGGLSG